MHKLATLAASVALLGCALPTWTRPDTTQADFDRDAAQCKYEAVAATSGYGTGPTARSTSGAFSQGLGEGIAAGMKQGELIRLCMMARGYRMQK